MNKKLESCNHLSDAWVDYCNNQWLRSNLRFGQHIANTFDIGDLEIYYIKDDSLVFNMVWDWIAGNEDD